MPYWRLQYHLLWATRSREPLLDGPVRDAVARQIETTLEESNVKIHAMFLMPDHVHLAVSIPPTVQIATLIGRLKGGSSHAANAVLDATGQPPFAWQGEYGILTVGERHLPQVVDYVREQEGRHAGSNLYSALERIHDPAQT